MLNGKEGTCRDIKLNGRYRLVIYFYKKNIYPRSMCKLDENIFDLK